MNDHIMANVLWSRQWASPYIHNSLSRVYGPNWNSIQIVQPSCFPIELIMNI